MPPEAPRGHFEHEVGERIQVFRYADVPYEPHRAFIHALHHEQEKERFPQYNLEFTPDPEEEGFMLVRADRKTATKVTEMMSMYKQSPLFHVFNAAYEADPELLDRYVRGIPLEEIRPQGAPYHKADFQHSVVENLFVTAWERNTGIIAGYASRQIDTPRTERDFVDYTVRTRLAGNKRLQEKYHNAKTTRTVLAMSSHDLPYIAYPFIRQLARENPNLHPLK